jgi:hypothetical protein
VPATIGTVISSKLATLGELQTAYGVRDLYDMLEIVSVDRYNTALMNIPKGQ